ncbi:aldose 1-epimerase family protein [Microbispora sp. NPDC049125]|uniref:aldose 1-epimerase family protein n=1 Tax=Microbispora sp. NPDC049125 TaxID=3154929 RepID=UPI003464F7E4
MTESVVRSGAGEGARPVPPTGRQFTIAAGGYRAVLTEVGAGLRALTFEGRPLVVDYPEDHAPVGGAGQLLIPWPNRVKDGRYVFGGEERRLAVTEPKTGNAAHGFVRSLPWTVSSRDAAAVEFRLRLFPQLGYPHVLDLTAAYSIGPTGLLAEVSAVNVGGGTAPYGIGAHPYLTLGTGRVDEAVLELPAAEWAPVDDRKIPTGRRDVEGTEYDFRSPRPIGSLVLDTPFTALARGEDGLVRVRLRAADGSHGVELWAGDGVRWLQLFTGDTLAEPYRRAGVAVEPMSCPPNAFGTGEDLITLAPGDGVTHRWGISALPSGG